MYLELRGISTPVYVDRLLTGGPYIGPDLILVITLTAVKLLMVAEATFGSQERVVYYRTVFV